MNTIITVSACNTSAYTGAINPLKFQGIIALFVAVTDVPNLSDFNNFCPYSATTNGIIIVGIIMHLSDKHAKGKDERFIASPHRSFFLANEKTVVSRLFAFG